MSCFLSFKREQETFPLINENLINNRTKDSSFMNENLNYSTEDHVYFSILWIFGDRNLCPYERF